ncbi:MAG: TonB C-terminal domain-containing protein [Halobacteriovoraceae bacterium]|nr:TonB C-terminal domain-containing protein [Halobacteriovoraceae bacterium]MCB9093981.1 TonB C-terminal domain-containing protein [Halobacteriovoraceae bacterium]
MPNIKKYFASSLAMHALFATLIVVLPMAFRFFLSSQIDVQDKIIPESVKVDLVGMPELTPAELKRLPVLSKSAPSDKTTTKIEDKNEETAKEETKQEESKEEAKESSETFLKKGKEKTKKKSKTKGKSKNKGKLSKKQLSELKELVLLGNKLSTGESAFGEDTSDIELSNFDRYALRVKEKVKAYWKLPAYLLEKDLRSKVRLFINKKGELVRVSFIENSGNGEYDKRVEGAIEYAAPFEKPEEEIVESLEDGKLILVFPF